MSLHPCLSCGACCAHFRVSFYWAEPVPEELTEKISPFLSCMKGTGDAVSPRCVALEGAVGSSVHCSVYERRPGPCRSFGASWESGEPNPRCDAARARHGLPALTPEDWK